MKNFIIKSNEWYDNIQEPKRFILCMALTMIPLTFAVFVNPVFGYPTWGILMCILVGWRMSYPILKSKN